MATRTWWESVETTGGRVVDSLKELVQEGNIRRVRIRQGDRVVAEFPLTIGVVGVVFAPVLAAVGALAALLTDCRLDVQREVQDGEPPAGSRDAPPDSDAT